MISQTFQCSLNACIVGRKDCKFYVPPVIISKLRRREVRLNKRHFIIPDTQVRAGVPTDHLRWIGYAIEEYKPDRVIHLGDHWDCHSVSSHNSNKDREGARILEDIEAGNMALALLDASMGGFKPLSKYILRGNHEDRLNRWVHDNPVAEGLISFNLFNDKELGWTPVEYVNSVPGAIELDGITYAHFFANANTGRAIGGNAHYKLSQIGCPFVQGHVQGYDIGNRQYATGRTIRGIVAGSCYIHDERYKGLANSHWRGCIVLNEVSNGSFCEMPLTLDYLCKKYEGTTLKRYLQRKYRNSKARFSICA